jgi:hypothetical protein
MGFRLLIKFLLLSVMTGNLGLAGQALAAPAEENKVKAAIIFNLARFVDWPRSAFPEAASPLVLGVLPQEPLAEALENLTGKTVQHRKVLVKKSGKIDDLKKCQIVFISNTEKPAALTILPALQGSPVLTVTDGYEDFTYLGGIINLVSADGKIRFQINLRAARQAGLSLSSQLIKLAQSIVE